MKKTSYSVAIGMFALASTVTHLAAAESPGARAGSRREARRAATQRTRAVQPRKAQSDVRRPSLRLPAFIALGVGGLGTGGAIATRLAAMPSSPTECNKRCTDATRARDRSLKTASAVLAGVAGAGVAVGFVLLLATPPKSEEKRLVPIFKVGVSTQKATASARWAF